MSFFKQFPVRRYRLPDNNLAVVIDLFRHVGVDNILSDNLINYRYYDIVEGDRPDIVSQKLYGTTDYYWTFFLVNPGLMKGLNNWPHDNITKNRSLEEEFADRGALVAIPQMSSTYKQHNGVNLSLDNITNTFSDIDWSYNKVRVRRNNTYADVEFYDESNLQLVVKNFSDSPRDKNYNSTSKSTFFAGNPGDHTVTLAFSDAGSTTNQGVDSAFQLVDPDRYFLPVNYLAGIDNAKFNFIKGLVDKRTKSLVDYYQSITENTSQSGVSAGVSDYGNFDGKTTHALTLNANSRNNTTGEKMSAAHPNVRGLITVAEYEQKLSSDFDVSVIFQADNLSSGTHQQLVSFGKDFWGAPLAIIGISQKRVHISFGQERPKNAGGSNSDGSDPKVQPYRAAYFGTSQNGPGFTNGFLENNYKHELRVQYDGLGNTTVTLNGTVLTQPNSWSGGAPTGPLAYVRSNNEKGAVALTIGAGNTSKADDDSPINTASHTRYLFDGKIYNVSIKNFGEYDFSTGTGNILYDQSGNGNHLFIYTSINSSGTVKTLSNFWDQDQFSAVSLPNLHANKFATVLASNGSPEAAQQLFVANNVFATSSERGVNNPITPTRMYESFVDAPAYYHLNGDSPNGTILNAWEASVEGRLDNFTSRWQNYDNEQESNRQIKVIKPALIEDFIKEYQELIGAV